MMGIDTNPERFAALVEAIGEHSVERCLPYAGMTDVPSGYTRFAWQDAEAHETAWNDACPAYALALLTYGGYRLPEDEEGLEVLWNELGGESRKLWPDVSGMVRRGWKWLAQQRPGGNAAK